MCDDLIVVMGWSSRYVCKSNGDKFYFNPLRGTNNSNKFWINPEVLLEWLEIKGFTIVAAFTRECVKVSLTTSGNSLTIDDGQTINSSVDTWTDSFSDESFANALIACAHSRIVKRESHST